MSRRERQIDVWMAALEADQLDEEDRVRLQEALEKEPQAAERAQGLSRMVAELRDNSHDLSQNQLDRLCRRVATAERADGQREREAPRRPFLLWGLSAGALAAAAVAVVFWMAIGERGEAPRVAPPARRVAKAKVVEPAPPEITRWQVLAQREASLERGATSQTRHRLRSGAGIDVGHKGHVLLSNKARYLVARGGARLRVVGDEKIELRSGRLEVISAPGEASTRLVVHTAGWRVEPIGTVFSVTSRASGPRVVVSEGEVRLTSPDGRVRSIRAGEAGDQSAQAEEAKLERLGQALRALHKAGSLEAAALSAALTSPDKGPEPTASQPVVARKARSARQRGRSKDSTILEVEELLKRGDAAAARSRALALLSRTRSTKRRQLLRLIVAESYLREHRYAEARSHYLRAYKRGRRSSLGAEALYMVGSIELEQLGRARAAEGRFRGYLKRYRRGRQRQGAYYLLCRSLVRRKQTPAARQCAQSYLREYPKGQFRFELSKLVETENR